MAPYMNVGCGKCLWCRIQRRREWTLRLLFESEQHKEKWFVTLTYDEKNNPLTIKKRDLQLFLKRIRKKTETPIRYYGVGEYGEKTARPHYHIILFGPTTQDLQASYIPQLQKYQSKTLQETWTLGNHDLGSVTIESIQYVAGYIHKKLYGPDKYPPGITPPFALMSKLIGYKYFKDKQFEQVKETGALKMRGKDVNVPRSYIHKLQRETNKQLSLKHQSRLYNEGMTNDYQNEGEDHTQILKKIKQRSTENFRSRIYQYTEVGHEMDLKFEDYKKLDQLAKQDADAVDYYLKQRMKNSQGKL